MKFNDQRESLNSIYRELADIIGMENTIKLYDEFKGQQVSFPVKLHNKQYVHEEIKNEFNGANLKQLAVKYGYSERTVRRIVQKKNDLDK